MNIDLSHPKRLIAGAFFFALGAGMCWARRHVVPLTMWDAAVCLGPVVIAFAITDLDDLVAVLKSALPFAKKGE
jgi:hypothetical protein